MKKDMKMKKGEKQELKVMLLGMSLRYGAHDEVDKVLPNDNPIKKFLKAMLSVEICGISAIVAVGRSSFEWESNIVKFLRENYYLSKLDSPILIIGESGTGKESMARVIHDVSKRKGKLLTINCTAIHENVFESELFGHEKGSFTGAIDEKKGLIEVAENGSVFLDELGKIPHHLQNKLLRVIEYKTIRRIGGLEDISVGNVRFIIAVQPDDMRADSESITPDLKNRLNIYTAIELPPLKERLKRDPYIIHDVLKKFQERRKDIKNLLRGKKYDKLSSKTQKAYEKFEETLKTGNIHFADSEGVKAKNQKIWTKDSMKAYENYFRESAALSRLNAPITISDKALKKLFEYDGYEGKNFRELENIFESAILKVHADNRKKILIEDLESVRKPQSIKPKEIVGKTSSFDIKDIPFKDTIDYAKKEGEKISAAILEAKIKEVLNEGKDIKTVLVKQEGFSDSDYQMFLKKIKKITDKNLREIKKSI